MRPREVRVAGLLVLLAFVLIVADVKSGADSPFNRVRQAVGTVLGPVETQAADAARPLRSLQSAFTSNQALRRDVAVLQAQNSDLRGRLVHNGLDRNRLAEFDGLTRMSQQTGYALVPSQVVAMGPAQSFSRTVVIDAGSTSGVEPDSTVVNNDGLVGRVLSVTPTTATVLLICDSDSVVGARLANDMKIGFLRGKGDLGSTGHLAMTLVDTSATPQRGEAVVSWGGKDGPYVAGIPIGAVTGVYSSPRELSRSASVQPFVDFSSLDLVGVVVPRHTATHAHGVIQPNGRAR